MSKNRHRNRNIGKKEITLMTLLAHEATADSRKLLKRHGQQDAKSFDDLEAKLAEFYLKNPDKASLEKELAEIHPHKKWILRVAAPKVEKPTKIEEKHTEQTVIIPAIEEEKKTSNACGCPYCSSSFDGEIKRIDHINRANGLLAIVAIASVVTVAGLAILHYKKS